MDGRRAPQRAVQPPARDHPRLLAATPSTRPARRPSVLDAEGRSAAASSSMSHALDHAGPQLQPAHPGRVARDDQGARDRPLRHGALDDRQRLLGRLARPAAGRQRLPGRLPGHHAAVLASPTRGRRRCSTWSTTSALQYFEDPTRWDPGVVYDPVAISAFFDHPNTANPITFTTVIPNSGDPIAVLPRRPGRAGLRRETNPDGVRCTLQDYMVNVFGARRERLGAPRPSTTSASSTGSRACAQGADLAGAVRRLQHEHRRRRHRPQHHARSARPPTRSRCGALYRTGAINSANNLDKVAIIDLRGPDPGAFHDVYRTYAMRARLERNFGTAANQVLWRGQVPLIGDPRFADEADLRHGPLARARRRRPAQRSRWRRRSSRTSPTTSPTAAPTAPGNDMPAEVCDADRRRVRRRRARAPAGR